MQLQLPEYAEQGSSEGGGREVVASEEDIVSIFVKAVSGERGVERLHYLAVLFRS